MQIDQFAAMMEILSNRSGEQIVYSSLGNEVKVDEKTVKGKHAFQVSYELPFVAKTPFEYATPVLASAQTLFSQLV